MCSSCRSPAALHACQVQRSCELSNYRVIQAVLGVVHTVRYRLCVVDRFGALEYYATDRVLINIGRLFLAAAAAEHTHCARRSEETITVYTSEKV